MPTRNTPPTSDGFSRASEVIEREQVNEAKIEWLRSAAKEGFDDIERGGFVTLRSPQEIDDFVDDVRREVTAKRVLG